MSKKFGKWVVKLHIPILIASLLLLIPATIGYAHTKVNYDMLTYLPKDIETMQGQDILKDEFGTGAFSMYIVQGMDAKDVVKLKDKIADVDHVKSVIWWDDVASIDVPVELLPDQVYKAFNSGDSTVLLILFDEGTSEDGTVAAVRRIRTIGSEQCYLSGMSAVLVDTEDLSNREAPIYVAMAVLLSAIALSLSMDSWLVPFIFLASIGIPIMYNLGTNLFLGKISYITKALAAVLQLGVTMDYSIFLWHSYEDHLTLHEERNEAMANAISETLSSIIGSSVTTIAGFVALCFMSFTLGMDLGIVMSKGVLFGVLACVTVLPSMILVFDKPLRRTHHKAVLPDFNGIGHHVTKNAYKYLVLAVCVLVPGLYGYTHLPQYYDLGATLPKDLPGVVANTKLKDEFDMNSTHILMVNANLPEAKVQEMARQMEDVDGVKWVLGLDTIKGGMVPDAVLPEKLTKNLKNENWQLILIGSKYAVASDEVNAQVDTLKSLAKSYDPDSLLIGEAPATKDLIDVTAHDFNAVSLWSIGIIFFIIALVFKSASLPFILILVIYLGITVNMAIPFFTGRAVPFIAGIVIGTIQLGSTVDYAILETTRYLRNRRAGMDKKAAVEDAVQRSAKSIVVSAISFFAATFGVGLYSDIDVISSLCVLMARGAVISMGCVIFVLPSMLMLLDKVIMKTTKSTKQTVAEA